MTSVYFRSWLFNECDVSLF